MGEFPKRCKLTDRIVATVELKFFGACNKADSVVPDEDREEASYLKPLKDSG